jgi:hypothetical protein
VTLFDAFVADMLVKLADHELEVAGDAHEQVKALVEI